MTFDEAFDKLIGHEGGYVNNPSDKGGETKYGISKNAYPRENIAELTLERAKAIYLHDYWGPAGCDVVPDVLRFSLFDFAVNSSPKTAIKHLQKLVGVFADGIIGPHTLAAIQLSPPVRLAIAFNLDRLLFWSDLADFNHFGAGWVRRGVKNILDLLPLVK